MLSEKEFEIILSKSESSTLDFKTDLYDFSKDKNLVETSKYIKDIISFSNTIRNEKSYIIFGVKEIDNNKIELVGIRTNIDDSILQDKVKDKVIPRPIFSYYTIKYQGKDFGIIEFPIIKYEFPITPTVSKLKGLEAGKAYYRNGTSNTEATSIDVIRINEWFKSLSGNNEQTLSDKISNILKRLSLNKEKISVILSDLLNLSKIHKLFELEKFCISQIQGIKSNEYENHKYRIHKVYISINNIEANPYSLYRITTDMIQKEMDKDDSFHEYRMLFNQSIIKIEELLDNFNKNENTTYATVKMNSKHLFGKGDYSINVFIFKNSISSVYSNIRQKTIDELMKINWLQHKL